MTPGMEKLLLDYGVLGAVLIPLLLAAIGWLVKQLQACDKMLKEINNIRVAEAMQLVAIVERNINSFEERKELSNSSVKVQETLVHSYEIMEHKLESALKAGQYQRDTIAEKLTELKGSVDDLKQIFQSFSRVEGAIDKRRAR